MTNQKPVPGTGGDHYIPYENAHVRKSSTIILQTTALLFRITQG